MTRKRIESWMRPNAVNHELNADIGPTDCNHDLSIPSFSHFQSWLRHRFPSVEQPSSAPRLVAFQHAIHQVPEWSPKVFAPIGQAMLVDEEHIVFEACVEVRL